jgi:hypothetical protein
VERTPSREQEAAHQSLQQDRINRRLKEKRQKAASESKERVPPPPASSPSTDTLAGCFATLGIPVDATDEQIKTAYRDLAMVWHPDRFGDSDTRLKKKAEEQFKTINAAYTSIQKRNPESSIIPSEEISIQKEVQSTNVAMIEIAGRVVPLSLQIRSGLLNREETRRAVNQVLTAQQDVVSRLQRLIGRFEREMPSQSRSELETGLDTMKKLGVELTEVAVNAGIIPTR